LAGRTGGAALALALMLAACGQKGPLYLPEAQGAPPAHASGLSGDMLPDASSASAPATTPPASAPAH
jgi:predicted small lipoprotein YifL